MSRINLYSLAIIASAVFFLPSCRKDASNEISTVTDIDGNVYHTILIGTQVWMKENLKVTRYRNGDVIPNLTDSVQWSQTSAGACSDYGNLPANSAVYGKLYNWFSVDDGRNIAPPGWHVATDADWTILGNFLGGDILAGDKLKETGTIHWKSPNAGADNATGFTALPGGARGFTGIFAGIGSYGGWWSYCGRDGSEGCFNRWLNYDTSILDRNYNYKRVGLSVRCVRD